MRTLSGEQIGVFVEQHRISADPFDLDHIVFGSQITNLLLQKRQVDSGLALAQHRLVGQLAQEKWSLFDVSVEFDVASFNFVAEQEGERLVDCAVFGNTRTRLIIQPVALVDDLIGGHIVQNKARSTFAVLCHRAI